MANSIDIDYMKENEKELEIEAIDNSHSMEDKNEVKSKKSKLAKSNSYRDFINTYITFNKGGKWNLITMKERDSLGKILECENNCYLHLHGISSNYAPLYSVESAVGIVLSNGNIGRFLTENKEEVNTYMSRDGGYTWFEVRKGSHLFEIGDHGGFIIIAEDQKATNVILYSLDEGLSWQEYKFSDDPIHIKNIITEPSNKNLKFIIFGEIDKKKGRKTGISVSLDFSSSQRQCTLIGSTQSENSDYEEWSPDDGRLGGFCLMGKKTFYIRRKRNVECFNGFNFPKQITISQCQCSESDYECDFGFKRKSQIHPCTTSNNLSNSELSKAPEECTEYYKISKGYRKVPGNVCINGEAFDPLIVPCPNAAVFSIVGIILFLALLLILVLLIIFAYNKNFINNTESFEADLVKQDIENKDERNENITEDEVNAIISKIN